MTDELTVLNALQNVLITDVNDYIDEDWTQLSSTNVLRDMPTIEMMPSDVTIYIVPHRAEFEVQTTSSDRSVLEVDIWVICKRDTQANLETKSYTYGNGVYRALKNDMTLDGVVGFVYPTSSEFYPMMEMNRNVQGLCIPVSIEYEKDF